MDVSDTPRLKPQAADASPGDLQRDPLDGMGLCLSGGGYRAMLYHAGALIRINEVGLLPRLTEISAVSGGSIIAAQLALAWPGLKFDQHGVSPNLTRLVAEPIMRFSKIGVDVKAVLEGDLLPGKTPAEVLAHEYDKHLFHGADLGALPGKPRFTFFATNLQTGRAWAFDAAQALDARVGVIERPPGQPFFPLAQVVAASSAFPPLLSPVRVDLSRFQVKPLPWCDLHRPPFTQEAVLTDGGVYDNLATERVMRHCRTMLISNAGGIVPDVEAPSSNPVSQYLRVTAIFEQRAEDERLARFMQLDKDGERQVAYWSIRKDMSAYGIENTLPLSTAETHQAASIPTRLEPFSDDWISLLLKAGYAGADAGLRARGVVDDSRPGSFASLPSPDPLSVNAHSLSAELPLPTYFPQRFKPN